MTVRRVLLLVELRPDGSRCAQQWSVSHHVADDLALQLGPPDVSILMDADTSAAAQAVAEPGTVVL